MKSLDHVFVQYIYIYNGNIMGLFSVLNSNLFKLFENIGSRIQALPSHRQSVKKNKGRADSTITARRNGGL